MIIINAWNGQVWENVMPIQSKLFDEVKEKWLFTAD
jgi:hypothetical protein